VSFLVSYVYNFGDFTEETVHFWPMANKLYYKYDNDINAYFTQNDQVIHC
jgi:hypothetical protein